jgi:choline dehydrogenase-like flavoprotein
LFVTVPSAFGADPASTDACFFPSIGAVNPTLTFIANALRGADKIKERLDSHDQ